MLLVQNYLKSGKSLNDLRIEHGVCSKLENGKIGLNYHQYEAKNSDPLACECRGLILRENTFNIIACPFFRFFNLGQGNVNIDWNSATCNLKLDGTLCIVYFDQIQNKWCVGTRKCPEADKINSAGITYSVMCDQICNEMWERVNNKAGDKTLQDLMNSYNIEVRNKTFMFELTSIYNRIVCLYDQQNLTLLGVRDNITLLEEDPKNYINTEFGLNIPEEFNFHDINSMVELVNSWNPENKEGVVVKDKYFNRVKIKNPAYGVYNRLIMDKLSCSDRNCLELVLLGKDDDVIHLLPNQIKEKVLYYKEKVKLLFNQINKDYKELENIENKKEFALEANKTIWPAALFALRNKRNILDNLLDSKLDTIINLCKKI